MKIGNSTNTLQLSVDIKNLANIFHSKFGVMKQLNPDLNEGRILKYDSTDSEGYPVFTTPEKVTGSVKTFTPNTNIGQCWYASVGIKYMFN